MSHGHERKEKDCLNCGTLVQGRFCQVCGQENIEPKESLWHLITHFFNDITHFDGKFFNSLKYLFFRPGLLPKEYMKGRRASYLNPIRMYVFTSALFFLLFFSFFYNDDGGIEVTSKISNKTRAEIDSMDSATFAAFTTSINKDFNKPGPMTRDEFKRYADSLANARLNLSFGSGTTEKEYESLQATAKKRNWLERQWVNKKLELNKKYRRNGKVMLMDLQRKVVHSFPQMLFVSLPLMALVLKLFYFRRKEFNYMSHAIFSIYLYIFLFIIMLLLFGLSGLNSILHQRFLNIVNGVLIIGIFFYEYKALRNFYKQARLKTLLKFFLINFSFFFIMILLLVFFTLFSLFKL